MINLETYLGQKTNFELETSVRIWLLPHPYFNTDEHTTIVDITDENHTLWKMNVRKEFLYTREFLGQAGSILVTGTSNAVTTGVSGYFLKCVSI